MRGTPQNLNHVLDFSYVARQQLRADISTVEMLRANVDSCQPTMAISLDGILKLVSLFEELEVGNRPECSPNLDPSSLGSRDCLSEIGTISGGEEANRCNLDVVVGP